MECVTSSESSSGPPFDSRLEKVEKDLFSRRARQLSAPRIRLQRRQSSRIFDRSAVLNFAIVRFFSEFDEFANLESDHRENEIGELFGLNRKCNPRDLIEYGELFEADRAKNIRVSIECGAPTGFQYGATDTEAERSSDLNGAESTSTDGNGSDLGRDSEEGPWATIVQGRNYSWSKNDEMGRSY
jgi:hypothetical protein